MNIVDTGISATTLTGTTVAAVVALVGAIVIAYLFLSTKRKTRHKGLWQKLSAHVNFDRFLLSGILKFLYVLVALYGIAYGLFSLFTGAPIAGLLWLVVCPVVARVVFEQLLLLLSIREEAQEGNDLLRRMQGLPPKYAAQPSTQTQAQPQGQPRAPQQSRQPQQDPRYAQRPAGYAQQPGYQGYPAQQRPAQPTEFGMTQRYAPIRNTGYQQGGYDSGNYPPPPTAAMRPTPADGTGRYPVLPMKETNDSKTK